MPSEHIEAAQEEFLRRGGLFVNTLIDKQKRGEIQKSWEYQEYPKMVRISQGIQQFEMSTETVDKRQKTWTEDREVFKEFIVNSEEEEERVLSGGKTTAAAEEERQALLHKAAAFGIKVDRSWSAIRLRRELGDKLDAAEPEDKMAVLEAELANLKRMAEMQAEIEALKAKLGAPDDSADLRSQLVGLGVVVDKRWGAARLREELERATAPSAA